MKPLRGSNREASKAPTTKAKGRKATGKKRIKGEANKQDNETEDEPGKNTQPQISRKRKAESLPSKIKGQENWKQMPVSSIAEVEKVMDLSILAALVGKRADKKEVQGHLNLLKKRFLDHCSTLKVPSHKQKPEGAAHRLQEETKKSGTEKQTLASLEENLRAMVSALEKNEQEINSVEHQCSVLRTRLQDCDEEAEEMFQKKDSVLNLLPIHPSKDETTLEAKMRRAVPDSETETMARKLGEILSNRESLQDAQELLSLVHKQVDKLLHRDSNPVTLTHCLQAI